MSAGVLFRNELLKMRRRSTFQVGLIAFGAVLFLGSGADLYFRLTRGNALLSLPELWSGSIDDIGPMGFFFASVVLILLVSSEFTWRTARQNVIDGLSKEQWFAGKLMVLPMTIAAFFAVHFAIVGSFGLYGSLREAAPLLSGDEWAQLGGYAAASVLIASLAFMLAMVVRGSGAAMGVFMLYLVIIENGLGAALRYVGWGAAAPYLPMRISAALIEPDVWSAAAAEQAAGGVDPALLLLASAAWTALFLALAFVDYMRRDL